MAEICFTIAGTNHHHGQEFIEPKMEVKLVKEPDNEVDTVIMTRWRLPCVRSMKRRRQRKQPRQRPCSRKPPQPLRRGSAYADK